MKLKCCHQKYDKHIDGVVDLLAVLAEKNRLKILCALKKGERCVCDIWQDLNISQNLTSHHLKVLKDSKLIDSHKEGLRVIYSLNIKELNKFRSLLDNFLQNGKE